MRTSVCLLLALGLLQACSGIYAGADRDNFPALPLRPLPNGPHLSVLVLGDWGTGDVGQQAVADSMMLVHADAPPDLVITVGDNFYPNGVESTDDPLWDEIFRSVYVGGFWDRVPFFPTLGNHDRRGSPQAQVDFTAVSDRWTMPSFNYAVDRNVPGVGQVRLFALDTDPIDDERPEAETQMEWLAEELERPARWRIAFGHHPFVSSSFHGGSDGMFDLALPIFTGKVDLYLAGHDHITEMLRVNSLPQAVCGSGAGEDKSYGLQPGAGSLYGFTGPGWCFVRIYRDVVTLDLVDITGRVRYRHFILKAAQPGRDS